MILFLVVILALAGLLYASVITLKVAAIIFAFFVGIILLVWLAVVVIGLLVAAHVRRRL